MPISVRSSAVSRGARGPCSSCRTTWETGILPTHIELTGRNVGLTKDSVVLLEQIRTIDKRRLREHMGRLDAAMMNQVDNAIAVSFGLPKGETE